jgi:hypothetical protein
MSIMMAKKEDSLAELTEVCSKILAISKMYSYLWDEPNTWDKEDQSNKGDKYLPLFSGVIAPNENFEMYIRRVGNTDQFVFDGRNIGYMAKGYLEAEEAALEIKNNYGCITPDRLRKNFCESLRKPLGKYLANKSLIERLFLGDK